jgi:hypothetical protein
MLVIYVPRTPGSTLILTLPAPSGALIAVARSRDGLVIARGRDSIAVARGRDGQAVARGH